MNPIPDIRAFRERLKRNPTLSVLASLTSDSAVYLAGGLLIGLGNVVLIPLYTRKLAPREFGVYALLDVTVVLIVTISLLKIDVSYLKWFADSDPSRHGELLGSAFLAILLVSLITGTVFMYVTMRTGEAWLHTSVRGYGWLLCPIVVLESLQALFLTDLRARRRPAPYVACASLRLAIMIVASYYLLAVRHEGLSGLFLGRLIGDSAAILFLLGVSLRSIAWRFAPSLLVPMLRFGLPLIWGVFAMMLQDASGRYFLVHYGTLEQVGMLGAAIKVGAVYQVLFGQPFGLAWGGALFQVVKEREAQVIYSKIFTYVYVLALGLALIVTILGPSLFRIFTTPAYFPAMALLPWVLLVRAMNVIEQPAATGIYLSGRTKIIALIYAIALIVNLIALRALVPQYGAVGVAWAWLLGSVLVPVLDLLFGQKMYRLNFGVKLMCVAMLPWILIYIGIPKTFGKGFLDHFAVQLVLCALIALFLGALLVYDLRGLRQQLGTRNGAPPVEVLS